MRYKTQKAPLLRSLKFVSKNANGVRGLSWSTFGPSTGSGTFYALLFVTLYDDFPSLTAPQGERSDHARMDIAEPKGSYTEGVESTVYRGVLSEMPAGLAKFGCYKS